MSKKHFLSVVAIFKNESDGIREWIEHYLREGVDHFYMIDNGSTDGYYEKIAALIDKGLITLVKDETRWAQKELYNKCFLDRRKESEWFLLCDLDEYVYSRMRFSTISEFLKELPFWVSSVHIPWKMFGSSGHIEQPNGIIQNFTKRSKYDGTINEGMRDAHESLSKSIVRGRHLRKFKIHHTLIKLAGIRITPNKKIWWKRKRLNFSPVSEERLSGYFLHLNHYPIQSFNWFMKVKASRGSVRLEGHEKFRDESYFQRYDAKSNLVEDNELANKKYQESN